MKGAFDEAPIVIIIELLIVIILLSPGDGKALQIGCLGGSPEFLQHVLPQESRFRRNGKTLQS